MQAESRGEARPHKPGGVGITQALSCQQHAMHHGHAFGKSPSTNFSCSQLLFDVGPADRYTVRHPIRVDLRLSGGCGSAMRCSAVHEMDVNAQRVSDAGSKCVLQY